MLRGGGGGREQCWEVSTWDDGLAHHQELSLSVHMCELQIQVRIGIKTAGESKEETCSDDFSREFSTAGGQRAAHPGGTKTVSVPTSWCQLPRGTPSFGSSSFSNTCENGPWPRSWHRPAAAGATAARAGRFISSGSCFAERKPAVLSDADAHQYSRHACLSPA